MIFIFVYIFFNLESSIYSSNYFLFAMHSNRSQQSSHNSSKITNNFQFQKSKIYNTRPNPQEINDTHQNTSHRYDITIKPPTKQKYDFRNSQKDRSQKQRDKQRSVANSYRVRKSYASSSKSQNGRTVYQIVNVRRNTGGVRDTQQEYSLTSKSEVMSMNANLRSSILENDKKLEQPYPLPTKSHQHRHKITPSFNYSHIYPKIQPLFLQKQWNMNQVFPSSEPASIIKQQPPKQSPLNPSKPQILSQLLKRNAQINLQKIPEQQHQQNNLNNNINKFNKKQDIIYEKQLIDKLNMRTKYYRFKHHERMKEKLQAQSYTQPTKYTQNTQYTQQNRNQISFNREKMGHLGYNNLYVSKVPNIQKIDQIQIKYNDPIQKLIKILHNPNKNRLHLTIKIPTIFHNIPDILLPDQQLKFKAIMIFEEFGIMKSKLIGQNDNKGIKIIKKTQSITFIYYDESGGKYCVNWYEDGSVYLGQMRQDVREGIGLQWVPGVYVYYGQYTDNMRHGYGIIKYNNMQVYIGVWAYDCYHGYGKLIDNQGWIIQQGVYRNSEIIRSAFFNQLT